MEPLQLQLTKLKYLLSHFNSFDPVNGFNFTMNTFVCLVSWELKYFSIRVLYKKCFMQKAFKHNTIS